MNISRDDFVGSVCRSHDNDRRRLLDIAMAVQRTQRCVDEAAIDRIAEALCIPRVEVEGLVTFYAFLSKEPRGRVVIRLCNDVIDRMKGADVIAAGLEQELGIRFGETTPDGKFTLEYASCIGMSDQAPAALVNDVVVPRLSPGVALRGVQLLKSRDLDAIGDLRNVFFRDYGDGNNSHDLVRAAVQNNLRLEGEVIFGEAEAGTALRQAVVMSPAEVIRQIKTARLRGRGGAGFPTGMKWDFTRAAAGEPRYLICNADEGEPGTFKDRVILTQRPRLLFEGMAVGAYAIGASEGLVYLRGEYAYLHPFLESVLEEMRSEGFLGRNICGKQGFDFDVRIQMGAGAYICGEETSLINSAEGFRGDPRNRPPFPAQAGYKGKPTSVNNVETLCAAARILEMGPSWFSAMGTQGSTGTKLLSVSGDCSRPGVYEVPFGTSLCDVFKLCGADEPIAAQIGGPSGMMIDESGFDRQICFDDLATGGALMVFGAQRNLLEIVSEFMRFFVHESCGYCTPCRVGNVLLKERIDRILAGRGEPADLGYLEDLANTVKTTSRCGLGQTSPNPVLSTLKNFRSVYEGTIRPENDREQPGFDLEESLRESRRLTGRQADGAEIRR